VKDFQLLMEALALKNLDRAGWLRVGIKHPESVAAHSFGVAFAAMLRCPPELSREKVLMMALLHDLAEVKVGDITPYDGISKKEKYQREQKAIRELLADHPELLALAEEAEARTSPEARFIKELDLLDMGLTALSYKQAGMDTAEFLEAAGEVLDSFFEAESIPPSSGRVR
jgi:putative hydrolase of HD superfamily